MCIFENDKKAENIKKKKKKSSENDQLTGHFQSFFIFIFFVPPTLNLKIISRKSTNKKILALIEAAWYHVSFTEHLYEENRITRMA